MKINIKSLALVICIITMLVGCGENRNDSQDNANKDTNHQSHVRTYTVTVKDDNGTSFEDVDVSIYGSEKLEELIATGVTNSNGVVAFTLNESDNYVITLSGLPKHYSREEIFQFVDNTAEITLAYQTLQQTNPNDVVDIGYKIFNYEFETENGSKFFLYDILSKKKLVILEFVVGSSWGIHEVTLMEKIYQIYKDDIEIIQVSYEGPLSEEYPSGYNSSLTKAFNIHGFPTTVYISNDGVVKSIHVGAMETEEQYKKFIDEMLSE